MSNCQGNLRPKIMLGSILEVLCRNVDGPSIQVLLGQHGCLKKTCNLGEWGHILLVCFDIRR